MNNTIKTYKERKLEAAKIVLVVETERLFPKGNKERGSAFLLGGYAIGILSQTIDELLGCSRSSIEAGDWIAKRRLDNLKNLKKCNTGESK